jgi:hypothetical protein
MMTRLSTILFPPGEDSARSVTATHEHFHVLAVHTFRLGAISDSAGVLEVNTVLVK